MVLIMLFIFTFLSDKFKAIFASSETFLSIDLSSAINFRIFTISLLVIPDKFLIDKIFSLFVPYLAIIEFFASFSFSIIAPSFSKNILLFIIFKVSKFPSFIMS